MSNLADMLLVVLLKEEAEADEGGFFCLSVLLLGARPVCGNPLAGAVWFSPPPRLLL